MVLLDPLFIQQRARLVELTATSRLPAMYGFREDVEMGALMAYGPSFPDLFRRAATYVDKILKGARPTTLPVEQPMKYELTLNLKTARTLGITLSPNPPDSGRRGDSVSLQSAPRAASDSHFSPVLPATPTPSPML